MPQFLRDFQVKNITIDESAIKEIDTLFSDQLNIFNKALTEDDPTNKKAFVYYTLRFDGKGYRFYSVNELLSHFQMIIFQI